jgi:hypothetical protein
MREKCNDVRNDNNNKDTLWMMGESNNKIHTYLYILVYYILYM